MIDLDKQYDEIDVAFPLGYLLDHCSKWDAFCEETGLNPWLMNEGIADSRDTHYVKIGILRKHGVI